MSCRQVAWENKENMTHRKVGNLGNGQDDVDTKVSFHSVDATINSVSSVDINTPATNVLVLTIRSASQYKFY